jgi:hypothetical protein
MSGRPYTYGREMAIAQLMRDMRRPGLRELQPRTVYLYGKDLFVSYADTIDWVSKLSKLTKYGREESQLTAEQITVETDNKEQFPTCFSDILKKQLYIEPIEGWPSEVEIAAEIAESARREKLGGSLSVNDISAFKRMIG